MRRLTAITVLLLLLSSWVVPEAAVLTSVLTKDASDPSHLPLCCRRDGRHHCTAGATLSPVSGPAFTAPAGRCPLFPRGWLPGDRRGDLFVAPAAMRMAAVERGLPTLARSGSRYRRRPEGSRFERGPPVL